MGRHPSPTPSHELFQPGPSQGDVDRAVPLGSVLLRRLCSVGSASVPDLPPSFGSVRVVKALAHGNSTSIFKAYHLPSSPPSAPLTVAVKVAVLAGRVDERDLEELRNEGRIAKGLSHTNICRLMGECGAPGR